MSDLNELYQELILDHYKSPHNFHKIDTANRMADGFNPLCGDRVTIYLNLENETIKDIAFQGTGCAISQASASLMTDSIKGKTTIDTQSLFDKFHQMVTGQAVNLDPAELGKLAVFSGVSEFPIRVKCATLAWHTLHAALEEKKGTVSTE